MKKCLAILAICFGITCTAKAQNIDINVRADSTFNAAEVEANTFKGFDVDINKVGTVNIGMQLAFDASEAFANHDEITSSLQKKSFYRQRADLILSSALPEHTNVYATLTFVDPKGGDNNANIVMSNLEIEHYFLNNTKIRIGRLGNKVSESQFFGRIALEETSAHVYGRNIFINDALEFDGCLRKGGPVYFIGIKPYFNPLNIKGAYAGIHIPFKNGLQTHVILSANRQFENDMVQYVPDFKGKDIYGSYELEVAYKQPVSTFFVNVGGNLGCRGLLPHTSGAMDYMKQLNPVVTRKGDSFNETFMGSVGIHIFPAKMSHAWRFMPQLGLETEWQGPFTDRFSAVNFCGFCKFSLTRRVVLMYYCTAQNINQKINETKPEHMSGVVHFARLMVVVGKVGRLYM